MKFDIKNFNFITFKDLSSSVTLLLNYSLVSLVQSNLLFKELLSNGFRFLNKDKVVLFLVKTKKPVIFKKFETVTKITSVLSNTTVFGLDLMLIYLYKQIYTYFFVQTTHRFFYRINNNNVTINSTTDADKNNFFFFSKHVWLGLIQLWAKLNLWVLPLILALTVIYWSLILRVLTFNKVIIGWVILFMVFYWLVSGFVFFFKKYQYGKYTSAIQRFWKRSYILFWLLETALLGCFIYLTFVASQESFYMFDQIQIYKTHLLSWRFFFLKIIPVIILIMLCYFLILMLKWNVFSKYSLFLLILTFGLTYIIWLEFYQFYHIVNFYGNLNWVFDLDERVWNLELEARRTRMANNYVMWLLILKFWHLVFVYIFWIFFVLRCWEIKRTRYPLLGANYQNLIILYLMSWIVMYPWIKIFFRKFMDLPYTWFYINNRLFFWRIFFNDLKIYWYGLLNLSTTQQFYSYTKYPFFYWIETFKQNNYFNFQKHYIKNTIITTLNSYIL